MTTNIFRWSLKATLLNRYEGTYFHGTETAGAGTYFSQRMSAASSQFRKDTPVPRYKPTRWPACTGHYLRGVVCSHPPLSTNNLQQHIWGNVLCTLDLEGELSWLSHCRYKHWNERPITHILAGGGQLISILHFLCPWRRMRHCIKLFGFFCFFT